MLPSDTSAVAFSENSRGLVLGIVPLYGLEVVSGCRALKADFLVSWEF